jgi:CBS-domain-containing membrane protein
MFRVKDIMTADVISVSPETEIVHAARIMIEKRINGLPVVDGMGRVVGILCQSDLVAQQKSVPIPSLFSLMDGFMPLNSLKRIEKEVEKIAALTVAQAMTPKPSTVTLETGIEEVASLMVDKGFHTLPVVQDGKLVGVVGKEDVLKTLLPS